jgi:hypothetical protein
MILEIRDRKDGYVNLYHAGTNFDVALALKRKDAEKIVKAFELVRCVAESEPSYDDADQGTFCTYCMAHWNVGPGLTYSITHRPDCLWTMANEFLERSERQ